LRRSEKANTYKKDMAQKKGGLDWENCGVERSGTEQFCLPFLIPLCSVAWGAGMAGGFVENSNGYKKVPPAMTEPQAAVSRTRRKFFQVYFTVTKKRISSPTPFVHGWVGG
jgi:hypothetical protein